MVKQGFWLTHNSDSANFGHKFAGEHNIPGAYCERCQRPFHRLLTLDTRDPRLELESLNIPFIHLILCFVCLPAERSYKFKPDGSVEQLEVQCEFTDWEPWDNYPEAFPSQPVALAPLTPVEQELIEQANQPDEHSGDLQEWYPEICTPRHQIGGIPFLIQPYNQPQCPACSSPLFLLAAITDANGTETGFAKNCGLQYLFHFCTECNIVHAEVFSD